MKQKKSCSNCIHSSSIRVNSDLLCRDKGAVSPDYVCRKHHFAPSSSIFEPQVRNKCIQCENFVTTSQSNPTIGLCRLFSVRTFDGTQKNACSKFSRRSEQEVS